MAFLYIQEYEDLAQDRAGNHIPAGNEPAVASQRVTFTVAAQSAAFDGRTRFVRLIADADAFVAFGDNPTATASSMKINADTAEYFGVRPGIKLSVYDGVSV